MMHETSKFIFKFIAGAVLISIQSKVDAAPTLKIAIAAAAEENVKMGKSLETCVKDWVRKQSDIEVVTSEWDYRYIIISTSIETKSGSEFAQSMNVFGDRSLYFGATQNQRREMIRDINSTKIPFGIWVVSGEAKDLSTGMAALFKGYAGPSSIDRSVDQVCDLWKDHLKKQRDNVSEFVKRYRENGLDE